MTFEVQNGIVQTQEQHHLRGDVAHVEGEKIGDREADDERRRPDDQAEFRRRDIGSQDRAEIGQLRPATLEALDVAARGERRQHLVVVVVPEADDDDEDERQDEEDEEHKSERRRLEPAGDGGVFDRRARRGHGREADGKVEQRALARPLPYAGEGGAKRRMRVRGRVRGEAYAAMNSFHLRTM